MENIKTCCFTGHRPQKLPWGFNENDERYMATRQKVKQEIENACNNGYITFISGMALGFDIMCAEIVIELKKTYPQIKLQCALPCMTQDSVWKDTQKKRYHKVLEQADEIWCENETYTANCMLERNEYMINNSSLCIALYDGKGGGTKQTIDYAESHGVKVIIVKP